MGNFQKYLTYAVSQNEGRPANVKGAVLIIVTHSYGEHEGCGEWCGYLRNPERYKHAT